MYMCHSEHSSPVQATTSMFITIFGKTTDFLVTYGLNMPLPYVIMCYFSSSSAFINGFQVFLYGKERWFGDSKSATRKKKTFVNVDKISDESQSLLKDTAASPTLTHNVVQNNGSSHDDVVTSRESVLDSEKSGHKTCRYWCVIVTRFVCMTYISVLLVIFAMGLLWRTRSFFALGGPCACFLVVFTASEYYRLRSRGRLKRCDEFVERVTSRKSRGIDSTIQ